eukprot:CAMPEP_0181323420 /NCGR_PEP_ID=MMETSP1101-20121128/19776_1 /TAXON_ID=46948 /ORGANISM="Rhodomonas abbreviata, Strain Caron Lab Isolate" /LENGTH=160 /DNA_ID=CAMNT_0023431447 /DNA_START=10 /DNA_END=492 /DNA_ORIENTATION=+
MKFSSALKALPALLYVGGVLALIATISIQKPSKGPVHHASKSAPVTMLQMPKLVMQARGVSTGAIDDGLPTITDKSIWEDGSPQNKGWSEGDYHTGTGRIKDSQYSWWQRHLMPQKDFDKTMSGLQSSEPHYDQHGNEEDPSGLANPMSYRNPGFTRMTP